MLYGIVQCTNFNNYQSSCVFQCNNGYFITGYSTLTCESNGDGTYSWNHEAPVCVGEYWEVVFKIFFIFCFLFFLLVKSRSSCLRWWVLRKLYLKYFLIFCLFYSLNHEAPVCVVELRENRLDSNYDVLISVNFINYKNNSLINLVNSLNLF